MSASEAIERLERWRQEAEFFDKAAERRSDEALQLDPLALARYARRRLRRRFSMEERLRILRPLAGKRILDVGCGEGLNAVLFARLGAHVTGIDVSQGAIDVARRRASLNGVAERTRFVCGPVETVALAERRFDVVWGDGILHHVLPELTAVLHRACGWAKPGGLLLFWEPTNLSPWLRRARLWIPVRTNATPGERPLLRRELQELRRRVPDLRLR